jgi:O-methyltransferase
MKMTKKIIRSLVNKVGYYFFKIDQEEEIFLKNAYRLYEKYSDYTMISKYTFIENLKLCRNLSTIHGCVVECGVWRGGMIAAIAEILGNSRNYYLFDSFEGLPEAKEIDGEGALVWQRDKENPYFFDNCKAETMYADKAMKMAEVSKYQLVKGWFSDTIPNFKFDEDIAILRLDGDWYESTMQCMEFLYPKVAKGGVIIVDDYYVWDGCSRAIHDYLSIHKIPCRIRQIQSNCYIIKE